MTDDLATVLVDRFSGREDRFALQQSDGSYRPRSGTFDASIARGHLQGSLTAGIYALRSDSHCRFGALDFDLPGYAHHEALCRGVMAASRILTHYGLDHLIEWSGNKGYHLWTFYSTPISGTEVRSFLQSVHAQIEAELDHSCPVELFPKQPALTEAAPLGNLIKVPWGKHRKSGKRSVFVDAALEKYADWESQYDRLHSVKNLTAAEIAAFVEDYPIAETGVTQARIQLNGKPSDLFGKGQVPCTPALFLSTVHEGEMGGRNQRIYDLSVRLYREGIPTGQAQNQVQNYNREKVVPPLLARELQGTFRSVYSRGYGNLRCEALSHVCKGAECAIYRSTHGIPNPSGPKTIDAAIATETPSLVVTDLSKINTEPPVWRMKVGGIAIELSGDALLSYTVFRSAVFQATNQIVQIPRSRRETTQAAWERYLEPLMATCVEEDAPPEASARGRLADLLCEWIEKNLHATAPREDVKLDGWVVPYKEGVVAFRMESFFRYLDRRRVGRFSEPEVWMAVRDAGGKTDTIWTKTGNARVCLMPFEASSVSEPSNESGKNSEVE